MLVLSRKLNEKIAIGEVLVTVLAVQGQRVRIGIQAPDWVAVRRDELAPLETPAPAKLPVDLEEARQFAELVGLNFPAVGAAP